MSSGLLVPVRLGARLDGLDELEGATETPDGLIGFTVDASLGARLDPEVRLDAEERRSSSLLRRREDLELPPVLFARITELR